MLSLLSGWSSVPTLPLSLPLSPPVFDTKRSLRGWKRNGMPLSCCYVRIVVFFPLICWGFCSKKLCTPEPYYKLEVSWKELLFALVFVSAVLFWVFGWFTYNPIWVLQCSSPLKHKNQGLTLNSTVSLPLYCLNRCMFVAPALTGTPPHWFISPVGLLAAAGDQTEEPGLSHQGNESEKREGGEEHYCLSAAPLCSQATLCSHLSMPHIQMHPISAFTRTHCSQTFSKKYI